MNTNDLAQRERIEAETLERVAQKLEQMAGSETYRFAFRKAAKIARAMKPECLRIKEICKDNTPQIISSSS